MTNELWNHLKIVHMELGAILEKLDGADVKSAQVEGSVRVPTATGAVSAPSARQQPASESVEEPPCPKCGGFMWNNTQSKRNPRSPDFKCRSRSCDGVIWPPR